MGRTAKIGLFLLMGLVVALARLVEVEVGKARGDAPLSLMVKAKESPSPAKAHKTAAPHHPKHAPGPQAAPSPSPAPLPAPAPQAAPAAPKDEPSGAEWPKGPVYVVKKGETLGEIAHKVLGSSRSWQKLLDANASRLQKPEAVPAGMRLIVPAGEKNSARDDD